LNLGSAPPLAGHAQLYDVVDLGFNYRLDELRAAIGVVQLGRLPQLNAARAAATRRYRERLAGSNRLAMPGQGSRGTSAHHLAVVVAESEELRDRLRASLNEARIQTSLHYPAISRFTAYAQSGSDVPRAEEIARRALTLPLHPGLTVEDVDVVCDALLAAAGEA
jgi:dTDP-4-amino-4,6-dideoxygalactose transaminase